MNNCGLQDYIIMNKSCTDYIIINKIVFTETACLKSPTSDSSADRYNYLP